MTYIVAYIHDTAQMPLSFSLFFFCATFLNAYNLVKNTYVFDWRHDVNNTVRSSRNKTSIIPVSRAANISSKGGKEGGKNKERRREGRRKKEKRW